MSNHTPGPWKVDKGNILIYVYTMLPDTPMPYKILATFFTNEPHAEEDAKLTAASPEMLLALQAALKLSDDAMAADKAAGYDEVKRTPECQAVYDQVKAAIEKATI